MSLKIAVDCGHGYTKALSADGQRVLFPSLIAPTPAGVDLGRFGGRDIVRLDGTQYLVGETARLSATTLFTREKATDSLTLALTKIAVAQVAGPGYHTVSLGVGLPLSWYASQKDALAEALSGTADVDKCHLLIESVTVFPQGIGALVSIDDLPASGLIGLADFGYRTVDSLVAEMRDGLPVPLAQYASTYSGGMHLAYHTMAQALEKHAGVRFEPHELVERDAVTARGQTIDLGPFRTTAFEAVAAYVTRHMAAQWDGVLDKLDVLYFAGGGAVALRPYMSSGLPAAKVLPDSQWANAVGFLDLMDS